MRALSASSATVLTRCEIETESNSYEPYESYSYETYETVQKNPAKKQFML